MNLCEAICILRQPGGVFVWVPVAEAVLAPAAVAEHGGHICTLAIDPETGEAVDITFEVDVAAAEIERDNEAERRHRAGLARMAKV